MQQRVVARIRSAQGVGRRDSLVCSDVLVGKDRVRSRQTQQVAAQRRDPAASHSGCRRCVIHLGAGGRSGNQQIGLADLRRCSGAAAGQGVVEGVGAAETDAGDEDGFRGAGVLVREGTGSSGHREVIARDDARETGASGVEACGGAGVVGAAGRGDAGDGADGGRSDRVVRRRRREAREGVVTSISAAQRRRCALAVAAGDVVTACAERSGIDRRTRSHRISADDVAEAHQTRRQRRAINRTARCDRCSAECQLADRGGKVCGGSQGIIRRQASITSIR